MAKKVLGKGLGAFFPEYNDDSKVSGKDTDGITLGKQAKRVNVTLHVPVTHIRANPNQPRKDFDEFALQELSESIRMHGLIQPVTVRHIRDDRYELISGERRLRATKMAGISTIPAYVREVDDNDVIAFALIENVQREQLNPIEIAMGYKRLVEECKYTQEEVAKQVGKNRTTVTNMLRLLNLPPFIQAALKSGKISTGHARALISIDNSKVQKKLLEQTIELDYSVRQLENAVRSADKEKTKSNRILAKKDQREIQLMELSNRLKNKFSTKVQIKRKLKGGEIRIDYYTDDELDRLVALLDSVS
ncbi:MAG: ParB/RepB/Spo0J family partition protein [Balneolales bacterium]